MRNKYFHVLIKSPKGDHVVRGLLYAKRSSAQRCCDGLNADPKLALNGVVAKVTTRKPGSVSSPKGVRP